MLVPKFVCEMDQLMRLLLVPVHSSSMALDRGVAQANGYALS